MKSEKHGGVSQYLFKLCWLEAIQGETKKWATFSYDDAEIYMLKKKGQNLATKLVVV